MAMACHTHCHVRTEGLPARQVEGQKATAACAAQERAALSKVDRIRSENAVRAETLEREAAEAEQKARVLSMRCITAAESMHFLMSCCHWPCLCCAMHVVMLLGASAASPLYA